MGNEREINRIIHRTKTRSGDIPKLLNMDINTFNKLDTTQLKKVVKILASEGNKRMSEILNAGETTPATRKAKMSGGWFSSNVKPKKNNTDLNALRSEYMRVKSYLESETGTLAGHIKVKDEVIKTLRTVHGINVSGDNYSDLWRIYDKIKETDPKAANQDLKYRVINRINEMLKERRRKEIEDFIEEIRDAMQDIYEEYIEEEDIGKGVSDFFDGFEDL